MIDRHFFEPDPVIFFRDLFIALAMFLGGFILASHNDGWLFIIGYVFAVIGLHRAGVFGHEIVHRPNSKKMKPFYWVWNAMVGAIILVPSARFFQPHKIHHQNGTFRTKDDPQYLLIRTDKRLAFFVLVVLPFLTPLFGLFQTIVASIGGLHLEEKVDAFTQKHLGFSASTPVEEGKRDEVVWLARLSFFYFICFVMFLPQYLLLYYAVMVGAWWLIILRIPLEHELEKHAESSSKIDQMYDSFTVETPLAVIVQPLGFRFHTAHHMYPAVPYHNLPGLHEHLKATIPAYNNSVVSYWELIKGPKYQKQATQTTEQTQNAQEEPQ